MCVGSMHVCECVYMELDWWPITPAALLGYKLFYMVLGSKLRHDKPSYLLSHLSRCSYLFQLGSPQKQTLAHNEYETVYEEVQEVLRGGKVDQGVESVDAKSGCFHYRASPSRKRDQIPLMEHLAGT